MDSLFGERRGGRASGIARLSVGVAVLLTVWQMYPEVTRLADPATVRIPWDLPLIPALDPGLGRAAVLASAGLGTLFMLGYRTRWSGLLLCIVMAALLFGDRQLYSNHLYLLILEVGLLSLADAGRSAGLDSQRRPRRRSGGSAGEGKGDPAAAMAWPLWLLMAQVSIVYLFAAVAKINSEFLSGAVLASLLAPHVGGLPALAGWTGELAVLSSVVVLVEGALAVALWSPRYRFLAAGAGVLFHLTMTGLIFDRGIVAFTLATVGVYPLFLTRGRARPLHPGSETRGPDPAPDGERSLASTG